MKHKQKMGGDPRDGLALDDKVNKVGKTQHSEDVNSPELNRTGGRSTHLEDLLHSCSKEDCVVLAEGETHPALAQKQTCANLPSRLPAKVQSNSAEETQPFNKCCQATWTSKGQRKIKGRGGREGKRR